MPWSAATRFLALAGGDDAALAHVKLGAQHRFVLLSGAAVPHAGPDRGDLTVGTVVFRSRCCYPRERGADWNG